MPSSSDVRRHRITPRTSYSDGKTIVTTATAILHMMVMTQISWNGRNGRTGAFTLPALTGSISRSSWLVSDLVWREAWWINTNKITWRSLCWRSSKCVRLLPRNWRCLICNRVRSKPDNHASQVSSLCMIWPGHPKFFIHPHNINLSRHNVFVKLVGSRVSVGRDEKRNKTYFWIPSFD